MTAIAAVAISNPFILIFLTARWSLDTRSALDNPKFDSKSTPGVEATSCGRITVPSAVQLDLNVKRPECKDCWGGEGIGWAGLVKEAGVGAQAGEGCHLPARKSSKSP